MIAKTIFLKYLSTRKAVRKYLFKLFSLLLSEFPEKLCESFIYLLICHVFFCQARPQKSPFVSLQPVVASDALVQDLKWNPAQPSMLAACLSDGSMMILEVTDSVKIQAQLPANSGVTCRKSNLCKVRIKYTFNSVHTSFIPVVWLSCCLFTLLYTVSWSPKGKQVAVGKMNATVSQYTPVSAFYLQL